MKPSQQKPREAPKYSPKEEQVNVYSHAFGFVLSLVGFGLLLYRSGQVGTSKQIVSFGVFGASLILLYAASTLYHSATQTKARRILNIVDHASIYVLIAGTYTPFALITLQNSGGTLLFYLVWGIAIFGIVFKLFFTGRFQVLSTILYVVMGWLVVVDIKPLVNQLPLWGLFWLFFGGFFYTLGAIIFSINRIRFNHAIFHFFVLAGSFSHFLAIYLYVLPTG